MLEIVYMVRYKLLLLILFFAHPAWALQNYRATYQLTIKGVYAGELSYDAFFTNLSYRIYTVARPSMAATMLGFREAREGVKGLLQKGKVIPQHYQRDMTGKEDYQLSYTYDEKAPKILVNQAGKNKTLTYDPSLQPLDVLSMVVQALSDIENNRLAHEYSLLSDDEIRTYQVRRMPDEQWQTPDGKTISVRVYYQNHKNRQTRIYFADNPLRLEKMEQFKDGKSRFVLKLQSYNLLQ